MSLDKHTHAGVLTVGGSTPVVILLKLFSTNNPMTQSRQKKKPVLSLSLSRLECLCTKKVLEITRFVIILPWVSAVDTAANKAKATTSVDQRAMKNLQKRISPKKKMWAKTLWKSKRRRGFRLGWKKTSFLLFQMQQQQQQQQRGERTTTATEALTANHVCRFSQTLSSRRISGHDATNKKTNRPHRKQTFRTKFRKRSSLSVRLFQTHKTQK